MAASISASDVNTLAVSGMRFLPKSHELIDVPGSHFQDVLHMAAFGAPGPHCVPTPCKLCASDWHVAELHKRLSFCIKTVHVTWLVIL